MNKKISSIAVALLGIFVLAISVPLVFAVPPPQAKGPPDHVGDPSATIYVSSQGKYYHTIVPYAGDGLPWNEVNAYTSFQPLDNGVTPYGPGDPGYKGGRWWIDTNENGLRDEGDTFFLCPLQGPGAPGAPP